MFTSWNFKLYILDFEILHENKIDIREESQVTCQHHVNLLTINGLIRVLCYCTKTIMI